MSFSAYTPLVSADPFGITGDAAFTAFFMGTIRELTGPTNQAWSWGNGMQVAGAAGLELEKTQNDIRLLKSLPASK